MTLYFRLNCQATDIAISESFFQTLFYPFANHTMHSYGIFQQGYSLPLLFGTENIHIMLWRVYSRQKKTRRIRRVFFCLE